MWNQPAILTRGILESPVSTPLSNQQTFVRIELLFLVENISY